MADHPRGAGRFRRASQNKAEAAKKAGKFKDEIVPVTIKGRKGDTVVEEDEHIREGVTAEGLSGMRPAFAKDGTVTAGNASGINDGAAAVVLMSEAEAGGAGRAAGADRVLGACRRRSVDHGHRADPGVEAGAGKGRLDARGTDLIESNEAFAAQACAVTKGIGWDPDKVNVNGGAIAIGHPIGASGTRILVTLLHEMQKRDAKRGLATLCIGGGMGIAMCVERD